MMEPGDRLGSYEILSASSSGASGEVWRARDSDGSEVAIRPLPASIAGDPERLTRLSLECQTISGLDHAHIGGIRSLEESGGARFLVSDVVGGESLADRLKRGAIPVAESLKLALQIAEALEAAHEKGIVHRDLNPANIRVGPDGQVRVLDFGLSGVFLEGYAGAADPNISHSPTLSVTATRSGSFSGTSAYLSPEQARGQAADAQADIWAFGSVLFEMLSGQPAFAGPTDSDVQAAVLRSDPDWELLPAGLDPRIRIVIEQCLDKRSECRASDIAVVRTDIGKALVSPVAGATEAQTASLLPRVAVVVLAAVLGLAGSWALRSDAPTPVVRFGMWASQPGGTRQALQAISPELAISPDATRIVFRGMDGRLYFRDVNDLTSRPVQITGETATLHAPFFSPDGDELFFVDVPAAEGMGTLAGVIPRGLVMGQVPEPGLSLKKIPVEGGAPTPVLTGRRDEFLDASWSEDGAILFADSRGDVQQVSANGGTPVTLFQAPGARHPQLLPGGEWVLYSVGDLVLPIISGSPPPTGEIVVQSLSDPEDRRVLWEGGIQASYVEDTGHIVYVGTTQPGLWAFPFDAGRLEKTGDPVPMVDGVVVDYALSETGSLAYAALDGYQSVTDAGASGAVLGLVNRSGAITERLRVNPGTYRNPRVSPDGNQVVYEFVDASGESHIWVYDLVENFPRKLTDVGENTDPIWKDDRTVTYASNRGEGMWAVYSQPADGSADGELVVSAPDGQIYRPQAWSPDGTLVLVGAGENATSRTGRLAMLTPDGEVSDIAPSAPGANEFGAVLSPDGAWLAYISQCQAPLGCARVQRFPPVPGSSFEIRLSDAWVLFSPDGRDLVTSRVPTLFFWQVSSTAGTISLSGPSIRALDGFPAATENRSFDLRPPDGQQFVMVVPSSAVEEDDSGGGNGPTTMSSRIEFVHDFLDVLGSRVRSSDP